MYGSSILALTAIANLLLLGCSSAGDTPDSDPAAGLGQAGTATGAGGDCANSTATTGENGPGGNSATIGGASGAAGSASGNGGSSVGNAGGAGTGGTSSNGGSGGKGGSGGSGGSGPFVPPSCANGVTTLPADAPKLTPGVWTPINPAAVSFGQHGQGGRDQDVFTQGMTIDPCNPGTLYLAACTNPVTGNAPAVPGLYRSTNAGTTWTKLGPFDGPIHVRIDPKDHLHMYVVQGVRGATAGFWVSTDGGKTFKSPDGFTSKANNSVGGWTNDGYDVAGDPTDFNHVLMTFHSPFEFSSSSGVLESKDGGNTWIRHYPISSALAGAGWGIWFLYNPALGIGNSSTWLLGTQGGGYWRTTDAGTSWTKVTDHSMEHGGGQIYYSKSGVLYAGSTTHLMKSTDNGATWTYGGNPNKPNWGYIAIVGDGTHLYAASHDHTGEFQTSLDSDGITWTDYSTQISHGGSFEMAYDAANGIVYSANEFDGLLALKVPK